MMSDEPALEDLKLMTASICFAAMKEGVRVSSETQEQVVEEVAKLIPRLSPSVIWLMLNVMGAMLGPATLEDMPAPESITDAARKKFIEDRQAEAQVEVMHVNLSPDDIPDDVKEALEHLVGRLGQTRSEGAAEVAAFQEKIARAAAAYDDHPLVKGDSDDNQ